MVHLLNKPQDAVCEMLEGLVASVPHLQRLDGFPEVKVVLDSTAKDTHGSRVAIISGGGSGHEPAHAGYVGNGMLTAAVAGDIFASPPADAVVAAIMAVTGPAGVLLIVKNYTGDRLNFGMAAEQAKAAGLKVQMVVVSDDCALPEKRNVGRRGIAGTVFVHKVAGAAAAAGLSLKAVAAEAAAAAHALGSMGVATRVCTVPGGKPSTRLAPGEMELGLGIHGEAGAWRGPAQPIDAIVAQMLERIAAGMRSTGGGERMPAAVGLAPGARVALMVNSLGATTAIELSVAARAALARLAAMQVTVERVLVGAFMTALDDARLARLDAPTLAPAWPAGSTAHAPGKAPLPLPEGVHGLPADAGLPGDIAPDPALGKAVRHALAHAAAALVAAAPKLDDLDSRAGDGDCGSTLKRGAEAVRAVLEDRREAFDTAFGAASAVAAAVGSMGGTSGALYSLGLTAAAGCLREGVGDNARALAGAFQAAAGAIATYGGAAEGDRTMLDALLPAARALQDAVESGCDVAEALRRAASAAKEGAEGTADLAAGAGRASYVPGAQYRGLPDPGALGVAIWLRAAAEAKWIVLSDGAVMLKGPPWLGEVV